MTLFFKLLRWLSFLEKYGFSASIIYWEPKLNDNRKKGLSFCKKHTLKVNKAQGIFLEQNQLLYLTLDRMLSTEWSHNSLFLLFNLTIVYNLRPDVQLKRNISNSALWSLMMTYWKQLLLGLVKLIITIRHVLQLF